MGTYMKRRKDQPCLWNEEYRRRFRVCEESARLTQIADEMSRMAEEDSREGVRRTLWPGAPYLPYVDSIVPRTLVGDDAAWHIARRNRNRQVGEQTAR